MSVLAQTPPLNSLNLQTPKIFSLLPNHSSSYLSLSTLYSPRLALSPSQTLTLSRKPSTTVSSSSSQFSQYDDDDDDEHVIGDCIVFEEGIFEDPYLQDNSFHYSHTNKPQKINSLMSEVKPENLVPEKWKQAQAEINITRKQRRKIAHQLEFGRRIEKKRQGLRRIGNASEEDYEAYRDAKLARLKPLVLDNPSFPVNEDSGDKDVGQSREAEVGSSVSSRRVAPRNPRLAVYGATLDDVSEFFNSGNYDPNAAKKSEGHPKLFTKEEKIQLNRRIPDLATATSGKWQPLHTLAASGEFYFVDTLLKHNIDINMPDKDGLPAIHRAILGKKQAIFNYLLRESANPFVCDKEGATLMHYAVRTASTQMIKILLLYNVDINLQDNDGWTPLHIAVQSLRTDVVRLLLIKGADKTLKNQDGLTPLDLCLYSGRDARTYELIKLMKLLPKPQ